MGPSTSRAPARELLEAGHTFPGSYCVKAFGPATESFRGGVREAALAVVRDSFQSRERVSSKGNSICITLDLQVETVDEVISVYERLHDVPDLKMIL